MGIYFNKRPLPIILGSVQLPPNSQVRYNTAEFNFTAKINSLGFRGEERGSFKPSSVYRILAIGDSFTFGWGLEEKDTWPKLIENYFQKNTHGKKVEVINLGRPADSPVDYLLRLREYSDKFNPDLIIIGILEGDDPAQLVEILSPPSSISEQAKNKRQKIIDEFIEKNKRNDKYYSLINHYLPNLYKMLMQYTSFSVNNNWMNEVQTLLSVADEKGIERYNRIDPAVRNLFITGKLNASLLWLILFSPTRYEDMQDLNNQQVKVVEKTLSQIFREMKTVADNNRQTLLFVEIPLNLYVSSTYKEYRNKMGFNFSDRVWQSTVSSELILNAAKEAQVEILPTLNEFRSNCATDCFYPYDGHLNPKGTFFLTKLIINKISQYIPDKN